MNIGVTGTRFGINDVQYDHLYNYLKTMFEPGSELHHGQCVGADEQTVIVARALGYRIISHPPIDERFRSSVPSDVYRTPKPFLERDHDIVDATVFLIGMPRGLFEIQRSGTWATIRYARKLARDRAIIYPDGLIGR